MDREPIWNIENTSKEEGATTFSTCGWCEHRGCGSYRHDCMLSGSCSLLKPYDNDVEFDTECRIKKLGISDIQNIIISKSNEINDRQMSVKRLEKQIDILSGIDAKNIPPLPHSRKYDHFNIGDDVKIWISGDFEGSLVKNKWIDAKVIQGYRHHDCCVSACASEQYHTGDYLNGCGYGSGTAIPTIILKSEYDYFSANRGDWTNWIKTACKESFNGKVTDWSAILPPI